MPSEPFLNRKSFAGCGKFGPAPQRLGIYRYGLVISPGKHISQTFCCLHLRLKDPFWPDTHPTATILALRGLPSSTAIRSAGTANTSIELSSSGTSSIRELLYIKTRRLEQMGKLIHRHLAHHNQRIGLPTTGQAMGSSAITTVQFDVPPRTSAP